MSWMCFSGLARILAYSTTWSSYCCFFFFFGGRNEAQKRLRWFAYSQKTWKCQNWNLNTILFQKLNYWQWNYIVACFSDPLLKIFLFPKCEEIAFERKGKPFSRSSLSLQHSANHLTWIRKGRRAERVSEGKCCPERARWTPRKCEV